MPLNDAEKKELEQLRSLDKPVEETSYKEPTFKEKAGAALYGAGEAILGTPGELEKFAMYTAPQFVGLQEEGYKEKAPEFLGGTTTFFPTIEDIERMGEKIGVKKPREEVSDYQTLGQIASAVPGVFKYGARKLLGTPSKTSEAFARQGEKLGFKLSPAQVRADVPVPQKGATSLFKDYAIENQALANKLASEGTGEKAAEITSDFIGKRLKSLGGEYDKLYKGKIFNIDQDAVNAIQEIARTEAQLPGVAGVSAVRQTAEDITKGYQRLANRIGASPNTFGVEGEALQRMRNALAERARSSSNRGDAHEIYNLIDKIDASIAKNHPDIAAKLNELRPKYRNSIILEDLYRQGGIRQGNISLEQLGNMLRGQRDVVRRSGNDIDNLGELGRELKLRARWETEGKAASGGEDVLGKLLGTGSDIASKLAGTRSRVARGLQKYGVTQPSTTNIPQAVSAGVSAKQIQSEE
jgi:hypothetical protein